MIVIFDLDGTLVDTYPVIRKTLIEVFKLHLPNLKYDEAFLESFFGPTLNDSFSRLTNSDKEKEFLIKEYRRINKKYYENELKLFAGAKEALEKLSKKYKLAILSNRIRELVDVALRNTEIEKYFDLVLGVDNLKAPKPDPDGINQILKSLGEGKAVFVGDALTDVKTAKNAKIVSVGVTWSLTTKEEFEGEETDYIVSSFEELINILEGLN